MNIDFWGYAPKKVKTGALSWSVPLSRADMRPPRDRAAGTQHRRAGAQSSFRPLPPWALGRDVALSPTRVQKDQVVAKVGSHCAACAGRGRGGGGGAGARRTTGACRQRARVLYAPGACAEHRRRLWWGSHARSCVLPATTPRQDPLPGAPRRGHGTRSVDSAGLLIEDHAVEFHHLVCAGGMQQDEPLQQAAQHGRPKHRRPKHERAPAWKEGHSARGRRMGAGRFAIFPRGK